jgi:hypothetical protein
MENNLIINKGLVAAATLIYFYIIRADKQWYTSRRVYLLVILTAQRASSGVASRDSNSGLTYSKPTRPLIIKDGILLLCAL